MSDMSLFFNSMSNVMNQWSDFRVSRHMYREYFAQQKEQIKTAGDEYKADKTYSNKNDSLVSDTLKTTTDKVGELSSSLSDAVSSDDFDIEKAYKAAENFVDGYNKLISSANESGNSALQQKTDYLKNMSVIYDGRLSKAGVSVKGNGTLELDKEGFMKADKTAIENAFGNKNSFATYVSSQAKLISKFAQSDAYLNNKTYYNPAGSMTNAISGNSSFLNGYTYNNLV